MSDHQAPETFDSRRQAELARELEQLAARPPLERADVFARAARVLPPPPAVARILDPSDPSDPSDPDPDA